MARKANTYRGNRKREAKARKLIWRRLPLQRAGNKHGIVMRVLPARPAAPEAV